MSFTPEWRDPPADKTIVDDADGQRTILPPHLVMTPHGARLHLPGGRIALADIQIGNMESAVPAFVIDAMDDAVSLTYTLTALELEALGGEMQNRAAAMRAATAAPLSDFLAGRPKP